MITNSFFKATSMYIIDSNRKKVFLFPENLLTCSWWRGSIEISFTKYRTNAFLSFFDYSCEKFVRFAFKLFWLTFSQRNAADIVEYRVYQVFGPASPRVNFMNVIWAFFSYNFFGAKTSIPKHSFVIFWGKEFAQRNWSKSC